MRILVLGFLVVSRMVFGWDEHVRITMTALVDMPEVAGQVTYVPLDKALKAGLSHFTAKTADALRKELQINKRYPFALKLKEGKAELRALDVVSFYSDEPDWGADQNLFDGDQYPELWFDDLKYVTEKKGFGSQAFRHQFYPGRLRWLAPIASFQIPMKPLGEGHHRAVLFFQLARDFFEKGQTYWGMRFLAWSIHYVEDLFQPFHVCQTPSKRFIAFEVDMPPFDIAKTAENIKHYHFAYEKWSAEEMKIKDSKLAKILKDGDHSHINTPLEKHIVDHVVHFSASNAGTVGSAAYHQFHPTSPSDTSEKLLQVTTTLFGEMGREVRALVKLAFTEKSEPLH